MRASLLIFIVIVSTAPLVAQEEQYQFRVVDLVMRVQDLGGRVEDFAVRETDLEIRLQLNADVLFDFDKANILPKAEAVLQKAAAVLKERAGSGSIRVEGHTDSKGDDAYNLRLSLKRADSVAQWLKQNAGVSSSRISSKGFGETQPVAPNARADGSDDPDGRQKNRRVEIVITK